MAGCRCGVITDLVDRELVYKGGIDSKHQYIFYMEPAKDPFWPSAGTFSLCRWFPAISPVTALTSSSMQLQTTCVIQCRLDDGLQRKLRFLSAKPIWTDKKRKYWTGFVCFCHARGKAMPVFWMVHHFGRNWNILTATWWFVMNFLQRFPCPLWIKPADFNNHLCLPPADTFCVLVKCLNSY